MSGLSGNLFILKSPSVESIANGNVVPSFSDFSELGGFQSNSMDGSASVIEITNKSSSENTKILEGRGILSWTFAGNGFSQNEKLARDIEDNFNSEKLRWFLLEREDGRNFYAKFKISSYNLEGSHDGAVTFSLTLNSSGTLRWSDTGGETYSTGEDKITEFSNLRTSYSLIIDKSPDYAFADIPADKKTAFSTYLGTQTYTTADVSQQNTIDGVTLESSGTANEFAFPIILLRKSEVEGQSVQVLDSLGSRITEDLFLIEEVSVASVVYNAYYLNLAVSNTETPDIRIEIG